MKAKTNKKKVQRKPTTRRTRHLVKMAVVPNKKNNYRPHLIRRYGLTLIAVTVICMQFGYNNTLTGKVLGLKSEITTSELLEQTNKTRVSYELGPLKLNNKLNDAAYLKGKDMFDNQYWAHVSPDGTQQWKWFNDVEYNYSEAGENLAKNFTTTSSTMTAWMNSPGHKENVLNPGYQEVGFAVLNGDLDGEPTALVVALYGTPANEAVLGDNKSFAKPGPVTNNSAYVRLMVASKSLSAAAIIGLVIIIFATIVAAIAHSKRKKLPKEIKQTWRKYHGLIKVGGLSAYGLMIIYLYGGGQIL